MKARDFVFWLQGYFELSGKTDLSASQVDCIKQHLDLAFKHDEQFGDACKHVAVPNQTPTYTWPPTTGVAHGIVDPNAILIC